MTRHLRKMAMMLGCVLVLAGCQTDLYSNLSEREANDMISALLAEGISAEKSTVGDMIFTVRVDNARVQEALNVLNDNGLPRLNRESIGQVFAKSGIVSSPFEERIRYIYALGEEVARTLEEIDGVLVARVHIVMPEDAALGQDAKPSSAAVFIKQMNGFDLDFLMPQVRRLVANSIEGVALEEVTVVLVEAQPIENSPDVARDAAMVQPIPGFSIASSSVMMFWGMIGAAGAVALLLLAVMFAFFRSNRGLRAKLADIDTMDT